jgi:hypothetical protein
MTIRRDAVDDIPLASVHIHVWSPFDEGPAVTAWDPDKEPTRFADGRGHALLELSVRLLARGFTVSIGQTLPSSAKVAAVFSKDLAFWPSLRFAFKATGVPVVVIESDWPRHRRLPVCADVLVRSSRSDVAGPRDVALPLLPQRGLVPRRPERFGRVLTLGYHGDPTQAPEFLTDPGFLSALGGIGVELRLADRSTWHDFSEVDAVLCMRRLGLRTDHKPPTKLFNAWAAGCIPLVGPEKSYLEWVALGQNAIAVTDAESVLDACRRLIVPSVAAGLETGCAAQRATVSLDAILDQWIEVISRATEIVGSSRTRAVTYWARTQFGDRILRRVHR